MQCANDPSGRIIGRLPDKWYYVRGGFNHLTSKEGHCLLTGMTMAQHVVAPEASLEPAATLDPDVVNSRAAELTAHNVWPREQLIQFQHEQLRKLLRHAVSASPYYRDLIGDLVARDAPLQEFSVMTKALLMANFDRILTDKRLTRSLVEQHLSSAQVGAALLGDYFVLATGGTTGERGIFVYDQAGWGSPLATFSASSARAASFRPLVLSTLARPRRST